MPVVSCVGVENNLFHNSAVAKVLNMFAMIRLDYQIVRNLKE